MTTADRNYFMKCLNEFQEERGEDMSPPVFAKKSVDQWKLWVAVQEAGGHAEVTANKGWARIGRLFDPPRTMTDLSFRIKKIYEVHMLHFEKAVEDGRFPEIYRPPRAPTPSHQPSASRAGRASTKRTSTGRGPASPGVSTRPKRARRGVVQHDKEGEELVGLVLKVYRPHENRFARGTVQSYDPEMHSHKIHYDEGDEEMLNLDQHNWHEDNGNKGYDAQRLAEIRQEAYALEDGDAYDSDTDSLIQPKPVDELQPDCVEDRLSHNKGYRVFISKDKTYYEGFCLMPGLSLDSIAVRAWETGKVMVTSSPKGQKALKFKITVPMPITASAVEAIITLTGQLYVKMPIKGKAPPHMAVAGESVVAPLQSETLDQEMEHPSNDDEAAISPDRSNAISPEKPANQAPGFQNGLAPQVPAQNPAAFVQIQTGNQELSAPQPLPGSQQFQQPAAGSGQAVQARGLSHGQVPGNTQSQPTAAASITQLNGATAQAGKPLQAQMVSQGQPSFPNVYMGQIPPMINGQGQTVAGMQQVCSQGQPILNPGQLNTRQEFNTNSGPYVSAPQTNSKLGEY